MKTHRQSRKSGFTLMELMVAMAITTIIVSVLVSVTSMALETWNRSRSELRASRQAKTMIDTMARDFEALVTRRGNSNQWLSAVAGTLAGSGKLESTNAAELIFFTAVTDRYNGEIGTKYPANVGDVSCVAYELAYKDPIGSGGGSNFETFVLNRLLVNPDVTFKDLLGNADLITAFSGKKGELSKPESFVCENVFQFSVTFHVEVSKINSAGKATLIDVPVTIGKTNSGLVTNTFKINGNRIDTGAADASATAAEIAAGRLTAVGISTTVISDFGIDQLKKLPANKKAEILAKNSYEYSKLVQVSSM